MHRPVDGLPVSHRADQPAVADRGESVLVPAVDPGQEMPGNAFRQRHRGDVARALVVQGGHIRPRSRREVLPVADKGDGEAENLPVRHRVGAIRLGGRDPDSTGQRTVDDQPVRPAEFDGDLRRRQRADRVAQPHQGHMGQDTGLGRRQLRMQKDRAVQPVRTVGPEEIPVLGGAGHTKRRFERLGAVGDSHQSVSGGQQGFGRGHGSPLCRSAATVARMAGDCHRSLFVLPVWPVLRMIVGGRYRRRRSPSRLLALRDCWP